MRCPWSASRDPEQGGRSRAWTWRPEWGRGTWGCCHIVEGDLEKTDEVFSSLRQTAIMFGPHLPMTFPGSYLAHSALVFSPIMTSHRSILCP